MAASLSRVRSIGLSLVLLGFPLLLLRSSIQDPRSMSGFDRAVWRVGGPIEAGIFYLGRWGASFFERWVFQAAMLDDKQRLERENREITRRLQELDRLEEENRQLRRALAMRDKTPEDLLSAEVTGVEQSPFFRVVKLEIDRGEAFVQAGMAVLSPDGVVGRIHRVEREHAEVQLLTDRASQIAVEVLPSRTPGILGGETESTCSLEVPSDAVIQEGDLVRTSGVDDLFPAGHPVGRVASIDRRADGQELVIEPSVRFDRLEMVWVVLATPPAADPQAGAANSAGLAQGLQPVP